MASNQFTIRDAGIASIDADFIVAAFDSTIPYLISTGNTGQWGTILFSERDGFNKTTQDDVIQSQRFTLTGEGERIRIFIAQLEETGSNTPANKDGLSRWTDHHGTNFLCAGMVTIREDEFAKHILSDESLKSFADAANKEGNFLWVDVLITDHRIGERRNGAGGALMQKVIDFAKENKKTHVYIDCWTGGTGKLVPYVYSFKLTTLISDRQPTNDTTRYYEKLGFQQVCDFAVKRKDGSLWPGKLLRFDV